MLAAGRNQAQLSNGQMYQWLRPLLSVFCGRCGSEEPQVFPLVGVWVQCRPALSIDGHVSCADRHAALVVVALRRHREALLFLRIIITIIPVAGDQRRASRGATGYCLLVAVVDLGLRISLACTDAVQADVHATEPHEDEEEEEEEEED